MIREVFIVAENQRGLLIKDGRLLRVLEPGRHTYWRVGGRLLCELFEAQGVFTSPWAALMEKNHPDLADRYFMTVRAGADEVAVVSLDGRPTMIVRPGEVIHVWKVLQTVDVVRIRPDETPEVPRAELAALEKAGLLQMRIILQIMKIIDGSRRNVCIRAGLQPVGAWLLQEVKLHPLQHVIHIEVTSFIIVYSAIFQFMRRLEDSLEKLHPAFINVRRQNHVTIQGLERLSRRIDLTLITKRTDGRIEHCFVEMLFEQEMRDALKHRDFNMNRLAGPRAMMQGGKGCVGCVEA